MRSLEAKLGLWFIITLPLTLGFAVGMHMSGLGYHAITVDNTAPNISIERPASHSITLNTSESLYVQVTVSQAADAPTNITTPTFYLNDTKMNISLYSNYVREEGGWFNTRNVEYWIYKGTWDDWNASTYNTNTTVTDNAGNRAYDTFTFNVVPIPTKRSG